LYIIIPVTILTLGVVGFKIQQKRHRQFICDRVLRETHDTAVRHMRALVRKRFQTLRHDDYGNLRLEPWEKEIDYFMENVINPRIRQLGDEEYAFYMAMQVTLRLKIYDLVEQQAGASESFTLGPNLSPTDYEQYCARQLRLAGWAADTTKGTGDQ